MSEHELWLEVRSKGVSLKPVKLYSSETLGRCLWYALGLIKRCGSIADYSDWVRKYQKEKEL